MRQQQQPRQQSSFLDRYRWWLFLGSFAINLFFYAVASAAPALEGVRLIVNVLSVIPLVMGIAGFFVHARDRRWLDEDAQARGEEEQSQDKGSS